MQSHSTINSANGRFLTQAEKIEDLLRSRFGQWLPAYELANAALQYCARINSIRKKLLKAGDRERVENRTEWIRGQCHGSYRIVKTSQPIGTDNCDWYEKQHGQRPTSHPWKTAFSRKRLADSDCFELTPPEPRQ